MPNFIKSNSCLFAVDSSPAFTTGERLGLYFLSLLENVDFSTSPARTQSKQIGSQNYGVDSVNFSPDVIANLSYYSRQDFDTDSLIGMIYRPSGDYQQVFTGANDFSFNGYLFFSDLQGYDLIKQIKDNDSFSGVNVISLGNCYLTNASQSFSAGQPAKTSCQLVASNIVSESLGGNYMQIPAINLESGTTGDAATIFLNPNQVDRLPTGNLTGILPNVWTARFKPSFSNLQIPNQALDTWNNAHVQNMEISLSVDRENSYGFGSDHVYGRDIKFPVQGSISINGIVSDYATGSFESLMRNESKQTIEIFHRDPQDEYLSGLSTPDFIALNETGHIVKNRWIKFDDCVLREKKDSLAINGMYEFSAQFDFAASENKGFSYKQGDTTSLDDFLLRSADLRRLVSVDGFSLIFDPFCRAYNDDCEVETMLSRDGYIMCTYDNYVEEGANPVCSVAPTYFWHSIGLFESGFASATSATGGFSSSNSSSFVSYPAVVKSDSISNGKTLEYGTFYSGGIFVASGLSLAERTGSLWYRVDRDIFQYSGSQVVNYNQNWFPARAAFSAPQINFARWNKYLVATVPDNISLSVESGNSEAVEVFFRSGQNGWFSFNNSPVQTSNFFSNMLRLVPPTGAGSATGLLHRRTSTAPFGAPPYSTNFFEYYPIGYRGTGVMSGSLTGVVRDCASGLAFDEGSATFNEQGTLRWNCANSGYGIPTGWNIYRYESGVSGPTKIGSSATRVYTDSTMYNSNTYGFFVSSLLNGYESWTGSCSIVGIDSY